MNRRHLTDDRLIDLCLSGPVSPADQQHLAGCPDCEVRRTEFASLLTEIDTAAVSPGSRRAFSPGSIRTDVRDASSRSPPATATTRCRPARGR
jgi:hypothetical protein